VPAHAAPVLQLDIAGGHYDRSTKTIVAGSNPFTLTAIFTPPEGTSPTNVRRALLETFYISAAVSPAYQPPGASLGNFSFDGQNVDVTGDMTYGKPPIEWFGETQDFDSGDLHGHDIYPTYFSEFAFNFSPTRRAVTYDSAVTPGGLVPDANGGSYYTSFTVDTRNLDPRYVIHFDMYNTTVHRCGAESAALIPGCGDVDVQTFAPFSNDAQSPPVPEPASLLLLGAGLGTTTIKKYRQRKTS
jgi:hypothetical protein